MSNRLDDLTYGKLNQTFVCNKLNEYLTKAAQYNTAIAYETDRARDIQGIDIIVAQDGVELFKFDVKSSRSEQYITITVTNQLGDTTKLLDETSNIRLVCLFKNDDVAYFVDMVKFRQLTVSKMTSELIADPTLESQDYAYGRTTLYSKRTGLTIAVLNSDGIANKDRYNYDAKTKTVNYHNSIRTVYTDSFGDMYFYDDSKYVRYSKDEIQAISIPLS